MKIGILTFHSQLNYGGVLQCWALQTVLEKMGHDVVVIDRWLEDERNINNTVYDRMGCRQWARFWVRTLLGLGDLNDWLRVRKTKKWLKSRLNLTSYHFVDWKEAPDSLDVDKLVVGSDQVWHCGDWGDPRAYLLEGAPKIPAIAYAASFGMTESPQDFVELYKRGLSRFSAISCREKEGVDICRKMGFEAAHVVDPTLLAWGAGAEEKSKEPKKRELVCYFLSENIEDHIDELNSFAKAHDCKVKVFMGSTWFVAAPSNLVRVKNLLKTWKRRLSAHVEVMDSAGPEEFYRAFKTASWVVGDSFHALMFSICNGSNARIIRPRTASRQRMFARISEFAEHTNGPLVEDSVSAALDSFEGGEKTAFDYAWINSRCAYSKKWLQDNLE